MRTTVKAATLVAALFLSSLNLNAMKFELTPLPYALDALAPKMGKQTLELHHGKHLQTYVNNLNNLIPGTPYENMSLEDIIKQSEGPVFNNAAQVWNHNVFFQQFSAKPQAAPTGALLEAISKSFGSFDAFKDQYTKACTALFGSGWVWLVKNADGTLGLESYSNAGNPLKKNLTALLGCDVWEHAYYLDYQNRRADYIAAFWQLVDWKVVEGRLK